MKKSKRKIRDFRAVKASSLALRKLADGFRVRRLSQVLDLVRGFLGIKEVIQGVTLVGVGLLVIFAGAFTQAVVGGLMLLYGGYLIAGGRL